MSATVHNFTSPIDTWTHMADKRLRGLCQCSVECEEVADLSDTRTSLGYSRSHWYDMVNALAWEWFNNRGFYGARK